MKRYYLERAVTDTVVTTQIDGVPHRVLAPSSSTSSRARGAGHGRCRGRSPTPGAFRKLTGHRLRDMAEEGLAMRKTPDLTWTQAMMAANTPMLTKAALVDGKVEAGVLPSGQVVGVIDDLPTSRADRPDHRRGRRGPREPGGKAVTEPRVLDGVDSVKAAVGEHLGYSDWLEIDQDRVNTFADATGDHQWIHVDLGAGQGGPVRRHHRPRLPHAVAGELLPARRSSRYEGFAMAVNYGVDKVRFVAPVLVGERIRAGAEMIEVTDVKGGGIQTLVRITIEIEGSEKPACVIESISRWIP